MREKKHFDNTKEIDSWNEEEEEESTWSQQMVEADDCPPPPKKKRKVNITPSSYWTQIVEAERKAKEVKEMEDRMDLELQQKEANGFHFLEKAHVQALEEMLRYWLEKLTDLDASISPFTKIICSFVDSGVWEFPSDPKECRGLVRVGSSILSCSDSRCINHWRGASEVCGRIEGNRFIFLQGDYWVNLRNVKLTYTAVKTDLDAFAFAS